MEHMNIFLYVADLGTVHVESLWLLRLHIRGKRKQRIPLYVNIVHIYSVIHPFIIYTFKLYIYIYFYLFNGIEVAWEL